MPTTYKILIIITAAISVFFFAKWAFKAIPIYGWKDRDEPYVAKHRQGIDCVYNEVDDNFYCQLQEKVRIN